MVENKALLDSAAHPQSGLSLFLSLFLSLSHQRHSSWGYPWILPRLDPGTDAEAETPILWSPDVKRWLIRKDPDAGKDRRQEEKGMTENDMVGWHHWLSGHEFE